ncbi:ABC transporter ATP-binding protein [Desulfopila sp. IMCC35008]|uniref:ABC transporter ATP-binding protein n=1 Tax=Desulfopila sp. IMCC35008 TaxID=2653858 RepID=UPI0013D62DC0|nr:dipeptide ABC transporter ATP-binding protein [Desulfopila sp. IMCC35008]
MLLTISDLNLWFGDDSTSDTFTFKQILHNISLSAEAGKTTAIVGESGSGKSVTALSILRLLEENSTLKMDGSIRFEDQELLTLTLPAIRKIRGNRISMIFQEPMTSLNPVYSVGNQLVEPLMVHRSMDRHEAEQEAIRLLGKTHIDNPEERIKAYPHQLSGGQRQRVMIAMALACNPRLLIADEPTTALDVTVQSQILGLIADLQHELDMAVLLITHDLTVVKKVADTIFIMKDGRVVESGPSERIFSSPQELYTQHLLDAVPSGSPPPKEDTQILLQTKNLNCSFTIGGGWLPTFRKEKKTFTAVSEVNLDLYSGTTCGIIGESGSGKTTLAMAVLKLVRSKGSIIFEKTDLQKLSEKQVRPLRNQMQVVFQDPYSSLSPRLTVFRIVEEGLLVHKKECSRLQREDMVFKALEDVGLEPETAARFPHEFSGGQRQRIAIARAIVLKPKLLILDEPTSALDVTIQGQIISLLQQLQARYNMTYLFISHDLRVVRAIADYIGVMQHGRIVEAGVAREIFESPGQEYTKRLFAAALS